MDIILDPHPAIVPNDMDEYRLTKLRFWRDEFLQECDWTQQPDVVMLDAERSLWADYRQELRDLPATVGLPVPSVVTFPDKPTTTRRTSS